jgi:hypothetical protein
MMLLERDRDGVAPALLPKQTLSRSRTLPATLSDREERREDWREERAVLVVVALLSAIELRRLDDSDGGDPWAVLSAIELRRLETRLEVCERCSGERCDDLREGDGLPLLISLSLLLLLPNPTGFPTTGNLPVLLLLGDTGRDLLGVARDGAGDFFCCCCCCDEDWRLGEENGVDAAAEGSWTLLL